MSNESKKDYKKDYKIEIWVTTVCFIAVAIIGGFFSSFIVIGHKMFFDSVPAPEHLVETYGESIFVAKEGLTVLGFPLHYFLLVVFSWIGVTIIGAAWCIVMDRLEKRQRD